MEKGPALHHSYTVFLPWHILDSLKGGFSALPNPELFPSTCNTLSHTSLVPCSLTSSRKPFLTSPRLVLPLFCNPVVPCALFHYVLATLYHILISSMYLCFSQGQKPYLVFLSIFMAYQSVWHHNTSLLNK